MGSGIRTGLRFAQETGCSVEHTQIDIREVINKFNGTEVSFENGPPTGSIYFSIGEFKLKMSFQYPNYENFESRKNGDGRLYHSKEQQDEAYDQVLRMKWRTLWYFLKAKLQAIENEIAEFEKEFSGYVQVLGR